MTKIILLATAALFVSVTYSAAQGLENSALGKMASSVKLQVVDGKKFKDAKLSKVPKYYILYYSASW